jgi:hypothetical protein
MKPIIVHMADAQWTKEAMHLASALAHRTNSSTMLLHLIEITHPSLLGWDFAPMTFPCPSTEEYGSIAEDYGVECCVQCMQYVSFTDALAQAVELYQASALFAYLPESKFALLHQLQLWNLNRQLGGCRLYTLNKEQVLHVDGEKLRETGYNRWSD